MRTTFLVVLLLLGCGNSVTPTSTTNLTCSATFQGHAFTWTAKDNGDKTSTISCTFDTAIAPAPPNPSNTQDGINAVCIVCSDGTVPNVTTNNCQKQYRWGTSNLNYQGANKPSLQYADATVTPVTTATSPDFPTSCK